MTLDKEYDVAVQAVRLVISILKWVQQIWSYSISNLLGEVF
jgi:hypothetical protein